MKRQLARISILQSSKIITALYVIMGLLYTLFGIPMAIFGEGELRIMGIVYSFMPILMAIFGFVFFVIFAALYNWLAGWLGGIEIEVKDVDSATAQGATLKGGFVAPAENPAATERPPSVS